MEIPIPSLLLIYRLVCIAYSLTESRDVKAHLFGEVCQARKKEKIKNVQICVYAMIDADVLVIR